MFSFINSAVLFSLFALTIPLIIHLLNRQKRQRIQFSSLRFLKFLEKQRIRKLSIYQYLLILVRTLLILMIIFAFARPVYNSTLEIAGTRTAITAAIILDNGLNMRGYDSGEKKFDLAITQLKNLISSYSSKDKIFIITGADLSLIPLDSLKVNTIMCSYTSTKFLDAWRLAKSEINKQSTFLKEIHLISDISFLPQAIYDLLLSDTEVSYYLHKIGSGYINNISIDSLALSSQIIERDKNISVTIFIQNRSPFPHDAVGVHLYSQNKRLAYQNISLQPFETKEIPLKFRPSNSGLFAGYVEIQEDDLVEDNRYYFSLYIPQKINVLFVDDNPSVYIRSALQSMEQTTEIEIVHDQYNAWGRQLFDNYDIIILSNLADISSVLIQRAIQFAGEGGGLIIIPGEKSAPKSINDLVTGFGKIFRIGPLIRIEDSNNFITLTPPSPENPLLKNLFRNSAINYALPKFFRYYQLESGPQTELTLRFRNNAPFFISGKHHSGFVGIFSVYFDNSWTDFQFKGIFAPFISRIIYLSVTQTSKRVSWIKSGDNFTLDLISSSESDFQIFPPDQNSYQIIPERRNNLLMFSSSDLINPGNYYLSDSEQNIHLISVNVEHTKLNGSLKELDSIVKENISHIKSDLPIPAQLDHFRRGIEITTILFILTILLILFELLLVKKMEGKKGFSLSHAHQEEFFNKTKS